MNEQESTPDEDAARIERIPENKMKACTNCGTTINEYDWFPIRGQTDEDGEFQVYSFCSEECVESWEGSESNQSH